MENWRAINHREHALLMHLLRGDFQGKAEVLEQMNAVEVMQISPDGSLKLRSAGPLAKVTDNDAPSTRVGDRIPVEGFYDDVTSGRRKSFFRIAKLVRLALHVTDGRISELEIYKEDGSPILNTPYEIELSKIYFY